MTDNTATPDVEPTADETSETEAAETPEAERTETFAEMAKRLFGVPSPSYDAPIVITPEMRHDMDEAAIDYSKSRDQAAIAQMHLEHSREWGSVVAREQAARLAS